MKAGKRAHKEERQKKYKSQSISSTEINFLNLEITPVAKAAVLVCFSLQQEDYVNQIKSCHTCPEEDLGIYGGKLISVWVIRIIGAKCFVSSSVWFCGLVHISEILLPDKGVRFIAVNNNIDSAQPSDNDFAPFLNLV